MAGASCRARLRAMWNEFPVDVRCEREDGHQGDHSAEEGEWAWARELRELDNPPWHCICGSGDDGEWHTAACAISNTPDDVWRSTAP